MSLNKERTHENFPQQRKSVARDAVSGVERRSYRGLFLPGFVPMSSPYQPGSVGLKYVDHCVGNVELGKKARITGTPTIIFADGSRVPGAIDAARIEKFLTEAKP